MRKHDSDMFPDRLLSFRTTDDGRLLPIWLGDRDEAWLRVLAEELDALAGIQLCHADERLREIVAPIARQHGVGWRVVEGVWMVERKRWKLRCASPVPPMTIRSVVFGLAARCATQDALTRAALELGVPASDIPRFLFADRTRERILDPPPQPATPRELAERYNLTLAESLATRSTELVVDLREHARRIVGYAKLCGLMATFEEPASGVLRAGFSGPLALFHETTKYGRALAGVVRMLVAMAGWRCRVAVVVRGERLTMDLDGASPLARVASLPRAADSKLEAAVARELRRAGGAWRVVREAAVVRVGRRLFFPDFALVRAEDRVLVEVVGFWTRDYLAAKLDALHAVEVPMIVCIDERHDDASFRTLEQRAGVRVLPFRKRIDTTALIAAADALARAR